MIYNKLIICSIATVMAAAGLYLAGCGLHSVKERFSEDRAYRTAEDVKDFESVIEYDDPAFIDYGSEDPALRDIASKAYYILNEERQKEGKAVLLYDARLDIHARTRAWELSDSFGHTRPNGMAWYTVDGTYVCAENIYMGYDDPEKAMASWTGSANDKENFFSDEFTSCAISIFEDNEGNFYWVILFASDEF